MTNVGHAHFWCSSTTSDHNADNCFECYHHHHQQQHQQNLYPISCDDIVGDIQIPHQQQQQLQSYFGTPSNTVPPMSGYTQHQIETIATTLFQRRDGARLVSFFQQIERSEIWRSETVLVAYIYSLYHANEFEFLFNILNSHTFNPVHFADLQDIWHNARYKESHLKRGRELNPVEKYRLRRKFPPPQTIWDGEETIYSFKENSRKYLKQFYKQNNYPNQEQKREICRITGLKITQISNWFKNRRQRDKPPSNRSPESSSSSSIGSNEFPQIISPHSFNVAAAAAYGNMPLNVGMFYDVPRDN